MNLKEISLFITDPIVLIPEKADVHSQKLSSEILGDNGNLRKDKSEDNWTQEEDIPELDIAKYEGNFQKGLLIIYQGSELSEESQVFLMNILKAVNHSLKDIALMSEKALYEGHADSVSLLNPRNILIFGKPNHAIMKKKHGDYAIIQEDHTFLFADDLKDLEANKPLKIKLWSALQVLFHINS